MAVAADGGPVVTQYAHQMGAIGVGRNVGRRRYVDDRQVGYVSRGPLQGAFLLVTGLHWSGANPPAGILPGRAASPVMATTYQEQPAPAHAGNHEVTTRPGPSARRSGAS